MATMRNAQTALYRVRLATSGERVIYSRGQDSVSVVAIVGATSANVLTDENAMVRVQVRDFIFAISDLTFGNGLPIRPEPGDRITFDDPDHLDMLTWQVIPMQAGEPAWRYVDETQRWARVHTEEIKVEAVL